jgi:hypothetical protein
VAYPGLPAQLQMLLPVDMTCSFAERNRCCK